MMPKSEPVFGKGSCSNKRLVHDPDLTFIGSWSRLFKSQLTFGRISEALNMSRFVPSMRTRWALQLCEQNHVSSNVRLRRPGDKLPPLRLLLLRNAQISGRERGRGVRRRRAFPGLRSHGRRPLQEG